MSNITNNFLIQRYKKYIGEKDIEIIYYPLFEKNNNKKEKN